MNLWALISSIVLSLGISASPVYHLTSIDFSQKEDGASMIVNSQVVDAGQVVPRKIDNGSFGVKISAQSAAVMDSETGAILWQKNANERRPIASITKLMTALVWLEYNPGWETSVTMTIADETSGAAPNLGRGETVSMRNLWHTALIASDNNATKALVRSTGLDEEQFVTLMNQKAKNLGLTQTSFVEVTGLDADNQSTATEILKLAKYAFANSDIRQVTVKRTYSFQARSGKAHKIFSTNQLLDSYLDVNAGKTGYISQSGYGLVSELKAVEGSSIITVVLGSASNADRFQDAKILSAWILDNFNWS